MPSLGATGGKDMTSTTDAENSNREPDRLPSAGTDSGTGDPNDDRAELFDQPPAKVNNDAVAEHANDDEAGSL
jgi:hypothetical protein